MRLFTVCYLIHFISYASSRLRRYCRLCWVKVVGVVERTVWWHYWAFCSTVIPDRPWYVYTHHYPKTQCTEWSVFSWQRSVHCGKFSLHFLTWKSGNTVMICRVNSFAYNKRQFSVEFSNANQYAQRWNSRYDWAVFTSCFSCSGSCSWSRCCVTSRY